jgi:serine O-acetyltransferase
MSYIIVKIYSFIYTLHRLRVPLLPNIINKIFIRILFGCQIGTGTKLGKNVVLGYGGLGIVIHPRAVIGDNVNIGPGVVIGGTSGKYEVPRVGENTIISAGAKIIGPISIGRNCLIGANAVVVKDIPDNSLVVGIPAKVIKENINIQDYK